jgi:hypothetical protein
LGDRPCIVLLLLAPVDAGPALSPTIHGPGSTLPVRSRASGKRTVKVVPLPS